MKMVSAARERSVGRKKSQGSGPRRYGTQIRVSDAFADLIVKAANAEGLSVAAFADKYMLAIAEKRYREAILREAERLKGGGK